MTIFLRIFLSFWIATVLIVLISMGMVSLTHPQRRLPPVSLALPALDACVAKSLEAPDSYTASRVAGPCGIVSILDSAGKERLSTRAPIEAQSLAAGVTPEVPLRLRPLLAETAVAFDTSVGGTHFVAVAILPNKAIGSPPFLGWEFVIAAVVSSLSCVVLTRHIAGPIRQLQLSTESFGHGNLDARPDASLLERNDELGSLSKTIGQMSARISSLLSSQKNFLIQVSHELGSPLTRLNVALALARRKAPQSLLTELDRIQQESSELNLMVQQLLRLARMESGLDYEQEELFSLDELILQVCSDNQIIAQESAKKLQLLAAPRIRMQGHRELLRRALDNVLRNAIRFTPEGCKVEVELACRAHASTAVIHVRDSGAGVRDDKLEEIFEPFVRASTDRSGAGLGLAIAKRAVLANRGTIRALNLKQGGLLIEITLPVVQDAPTEVATTHWEPGVAPMTSSGHMD